MTIIKMTSQKIYQAKRRLQNKSSEHQGANIITILYFFNFYDKQSNGLDISQTRLKLVQLLGVTLQKQPILSHFCTEKDFLRLKMKDVSLLPQRNGGLLQFSEITYP